MSFMFVIVKIIDAYINVLKDDSLRFYLLLWAIKSPFIFPFLFLPYCNILHALCNTFYSLCNDESI